MSIRKPISSPLSCLPLHPAHPQGARGNDGLPGPAGPNVSIKYPIFVSSTVNVIVLFSKQIIESKVITDL